MSKLKSLAQFTILTSTLVLLYFQLIHWHSQWLGIFLLGVFLVIIGEWWSIILRRLASLSAHQWGVRLLGMLIGFVILSLIPGIFVALYRLTGIEIWLSFVLTTLISVTILKIIKKTKSSPPRIDDWDVPRRISFFTGRAIYPFLYLVLWLIGLGLLWRSESALSLLSPWQTISAGLILIFFILTILLGIIILANFKIRTILFLIILQSILIHSYLPLTHQLPWGGDGWRHLANEKRIVTNDFIHPVLVDNQGNWDIQMVSNVKLPTILFNPQKISYSQLWGTSVLLNQTLNIDLILVMKWFGPILWSIFAPIIFFYLGWVLFRSYQRGVWLSALTLTPFSLQATGSLTLPVGIGLLCFFLVFWLWCLYWRFGLPAQKRLAIFFTGLLLFSYGLFCLLAVFLLIFGWGLKRILASSHSLLRKSSVAVLAMFSIFYLPTIELISRVSYMPEQINLLENSKQLIGQLSGWFFAQQIRPHDILSGNIFFNHTPSYAFVANVFSNWRWPVMVMMLLMIVLTVLGLVYIFKAKEKLLWGMIGLLFLVVAGGYGLGWFVLAGDRLLIRRLDGILAIMILILVLGGWEYLIKHGNTENLQITAEKNILSWRSRTVALFGVLFTSWFATICFASGPDLPVVSVAEYQAADYVWQGEQILSKLNQQKFCVIGDTWPLLALEGISTGAVVGGGFPIGYQFDQPERLAIYREALNDPREAVLTVAKQKTGADRCWIILPAENFALNQDRFMVLGGEVRYFGNVAVWREGLK